MVVVVTGGVFLLLVVAVLSLLRDVSGEDYLVRVIDNLLLAMASVFLMDGVDKLLLVSVDDNLLLRCVEDSLLIWRDKLLLLIWIDNLLLI